MGAPLLNTSNLKHGLRSNLAIADHRLENGRYPRGYERPERVRNHIRRVTECIVKQVHGEISFVAALAISTAARWEGHAAICMKLLRDGKDLTVDQRANLSERIARASAERDKAIDRLKLDRSSKDAMSDALDVLYAPTSLTDQQPATDAGDAATASDVAQPEGTDVGPDRPNMD